MSWFDHINWTKLGFVVMAPRRGAEAQRYSSWIKMDFELIDFETLSFGIGKKLKLCAFALSREIIWVYLNSSEL